MKFHFILPFCLVLFSTTSLYNYNSGSMSQSNSGYLKVMEFKNGRYNFAKKYFYLYAYQYVNVRNYEIVIENHNFSFSGYLDEGGELQLLGLTADEKYLCYENSNYYLKVPFDSDLGILFKSKMVNSCRVNVLGYDVSNVWQCLTCD